MFHALRARLQVLILLGRINIKTGGINSYVQPSASIMGLMKDSMMVGEYSRRSYTLIPGSLNIEITGCDVTHPAPGVTTRPSVASLVASIDEGATRYRVYLDAQPPRQEMITNIASMLEVSTEIVTCIISHADLFAAGRAAQLPGEAR